MNNIYFTTFIVTAVWDIVLRLYAESSLTDKPDFVKVLIPYFRQKSVLNAAILAGIVGLVTQLIILRIVPFPKTLEFKFLFITFLVSGLVGFPLERLRLIPLLTDTYYKNLGRPRSFFTDGYSGLVVQLTLFALKKKIII